MSRVYNRVPDAHDPHDPHYKIRVTASVLPNRVDERRLFSPVENQDVLGSCTGHAFVGAMEYLENQQREDFVRLSRLFVYFNERLLEGTTRSDAGAQIRDGVRVLAKYGVCDEKLWPYDEKRFRHRPTDDAYENGLLHKATAFSKIDQTEHVLCAALAARHPVVFGIVVYESFESDEVAKTGLVPMPSVKEKCLGGHAVCMAGYDRGSRHFLVRNSWGADWGIGGYFWLPFDFVLDPRLSDSFWAVTRIE
jgi:C1A family cysteine protease